MNEKYACQFCQREYRRKDWTQTGMQFINCQFCLVTFYLYKDDLISLQYRLHDPVWDRLLVNFGTEKTYVQLHPKQRKIKNPPPDGSFSFNVCRIVKPKEALPLAQRLTSLLIFS